MYYSSSSYSQALSTTTGVIGTTLSVGEPVLPPFQDNRPTGHHVLLDAVLVCGFHEQVRQVAQDLRLIGAIISVTSLVLSAFATSGWQLIITQGILQALGSTLLYSSTTKFLDEWFLARKGLAYGVILSAKSVLGIGGPLLFGALLSKVGCKNTLLSWAAIIASTAGPSIFLLKPRWTTTLQARRSRQLFWAFLKHSTFLVFQIASVVFSIGYCLPQTYLASFGSGVLHLGTTKSSLMVAILNAPSIVSNCLFGMLSDGKPIYHEHVMSVSTVTVLSAIGSSLPILLLWASRRRSLRVWHSWLCSLYCMASLRENTRQLGVV